MKLGILNEPNGNRIAMTPSAAKKLKAIGVEVLIESGAGHNAHFSDKDFEGSATIQTRNEVIASSSLIAFVSKPDKEVLQEISRNKYVFSGFQPFSDKTIIDELKELGLAAFSYDMIPRTTIAQSMDVLSSMASIAGYQAVLTACNYLPRYMPMMSTAAGTIKPAKVLVLGAAVAGLQAIATAKRLGAIVEAFDTRSASKEEVESLGAKFIEVEGAAEDKGAGGYGVQQSEEFLQKQRQIVKEKSEKADIIITTAQVRGRKAPTLVTQETVEHMQAGSVIVDLASSTGGNCELSVDNEVVTHKGVTIIGNSNLADQMPQDASTLFANNLVNFLKILVKDGEIVLDLENPIISESLITK